MTGLRNEALHAFVLQVSERRMNEQNSLIPSECP